MKKCWFLTASRIGRVRRDNCCAIMAPGHKLRINAEKAEDDEFYIGFGGRDGDLNLSPSGDLCEAAANLFAFLRRADALAGSRTLAMAPIPENGIGLGDQRPHQAGVSRLTSVNSMSFCSGL